MTANDPYQEWDAAYVLGALSADDQGAFEQHLANCDHCTTAVTELAAVPGLLATMPAEDAVASLDEPGSNEAPPEDMFPRLVAAVNAHQRRVRRRMADVAAVVALVVGVVVPVMLVSDTGDGDALAEAIELTEADPTPLSASVRLIEQPWGTQLEGECHYEQSSAGEGGRRYSSGHAGTYAMYVVAVDGSAHRVASWTAAPGVTVSPQGMVELSPDEIARVDIRSVESGQVLLERDV